MATLSLTDLDLNSNLDTSPVNAIFAEIENYLNGVTNNADITLLNGKITTSEFKSLFDGSGINTPGAMTFGAGSDSAIYWDGSDFVVDMVSAITNSSQYLTLKHTTGNTPALGIGVGIKAIVETSESNNEVGGLAEFITSDVANGSEDFDFVIKLMNDGVSASEIGRFTSKGKLNLVAGADYQIDGVDVLSSTALGSGVLTSSLTAVGALNSGSITSGFGSIDTGASPITTTGIVTGGAFTTTGAITAGTLTTTGAVGIGTETPAHLLEIESSDPKISIRTTSGSSRRYTFHVTGSTVTDGLAIRDESGALELARFRRDGTILFGSLSTSGIDNGTLKWNSSTGEIWADSSSLRFKENIRDLEIDSSKIYNLCGKQFNKKKINEDYIVRDQIGYIAEEVNEHIPIIVGKDNEGDPFSVNYEYLTVLIIEELKKIKDQLNG